MKELSPQNLSSFQASNRIRAVSSHHAAVPLYLFLYKLLHIEPDKTESIEPLPDFDAGAEPT